MQAQKQAFYKKKLIKSIKNMHKKKACMQYELISYQSFASDRCEGGRLNIFFFGIFATSLPWHPI